MSKQLFSRRKSSTRGGRAKFYEMLEFVKSQKHKTAIVVNCVDRLQRGYKECVELDNETDEMLANIAEIAANIGIFLKSPIVAQKREILRLILSDCKTEGKNIAFSIVKPFDELLKTPETDKWCTWPESNRHVLADNRF